MTVLPPWHVTWEPSYFGSLCLTARLSARGNAAFAVISPRGDGQGYSVRLAPRGIEGPNAWCRADSIPWAQRMVQRWARSHWRTVETQVRHWEGRSAARE